MVETVHRCAIALLLVLTACGTQATEGDLADSVGSSSTSTSGPDFASTSLAHDNNVTEEEGPAIAPETPDKSIVEERALSDLAARLSVEKESIKTESVETGVWSDGSIGCPEPGKVYTQALVPGTRVTLVRDGRTYMYHQGGSGETFLCEDPSDGLFRGVEGDELIPPPGYNE